MAITEDDVKRQSAVYARHVAWCRTYAPDMSDQAMDAEALQKVDESVFGVGCARDGRGNFIPQGIGSKGKESLNHLAAILKYESRAAYDREVARIWRETPDHARKLGLAQPQRTP